ncbi:hypothetical protein AWB75_05520 [Caballeronia catudaia]|uniref:Uncharacterized protein n=1 Tax=Caballeronia catudaia TaxID=1777136 RepID=A0A158CPP6_9BURK|nr:hypothetical protein AWB75_05520 [Caballeronia catudaia]
MVRIIPYRGFEFTRPWWPRRRTYNVSFQNIGGSSLSVLGAPGRRIPLHNGPFTRRWSYLIAECAGQAAIDLLIGPPDNDG